jgi:imidazolonepropionase
MIRRSPDASTQGLILVRGARQLLTLRGPAGPRRGGALGDLGIVADGAVLIQNGNILEAGPTRRVENLALARAAREINAAGRLIMPGLVDSRTQPVFESTLPAGRLEASARNMLAGMARHGTTILAANATQGPDIAGALRILRLLRSLDGRPLDVIAAYDISPLATDPALVEAICAEALPIISRRKLARFVSLSGEDPDAAVTRRCLERARELGFPLTVNAGASAAGARMAVEVQATSVALDSIDPASIADLARSRTIALLAPASVYSRRLKRPPPGRALIDAGAAIALASGFGLEQCPTYNMQMVISLACLEMGLSQAEAISAATINGAHALGRGLRCGSLEPGKSADLLLLNVKDYREMAQQFGINHVHMALKSGMVVYQEGEVTGWNTK